MDIYGLKYTSGSILRNGVTYELRILQRGYTGDTLEIGDIQQLGLEVQGGSGGIDQPIIKTLLHFTMVDSVDMGTVEGVKHGGWEEFYTPDATLYLVRLIRESVIIWAGYITPDAWSDSLVYRGSITITARDNMGHMADFEFSKAALLEAMVYLGGEAYDRVRDENLVSVYGLIFSAFYVAGIDMPLRNRWDENDTGKEPHMKAGTYDVLDWLIDIDALQELNWYEAVERVLASTGLALRWCGYDGICLMSLRALHKMGRTNPPVRNVNFINRSGHRTLDPAYKQIVEKVNYDPVEGFEAKWAQADFTTTERGYWQPVSSLTANSIWTQADSTKEVLRYGSPSVLPVGNDITGEEDKYVLLASRPTELHTQYNTERVAYIDPDNYVWYRKRLSPGTIVSVGFEVAHCYKGDGSVLYDAKLPAGAVRYAILWRKTDGTFLSLQGDTWVSGVSPMTVDIIQRRGYTDGMAEVDSAAVSNNFQTPDVAGFLELRIYPYQNLISVAEREEYYDNDWVDAHVRLGNITFDINTEAIPRYFKTTTVYDPAQNKTLKRNVDFGAVPTRFSTAGTIRNGFYKPDAANGYPSIMNCHWDGSQTELPLPVLNHLQILSLHAKANSVLTGELRDANGLTIVMDAVWLYAGRTFLLLSGTWNIFADRIQNAILREYDTYADAIGSISADYDTELSGGDARLMALQKSVNAAASLAKNAGGSESGGGGGGSTVAISNLLTTGARIGTLTINGTNYDIKASVVALSNRLTSGDRILTINLNGTDYDIKAPQYSLVSVRDRLTSGTRIARLQINNDVYDLYAPGGSVGISDLISNGFLIGVLTIGTTSYNIKIPVPDISIGGTDAAPTVVVAVGSGNSDSVALPVATATKAGIVSTGAQTFGGYKTFTRIYLGNSEARGAYLEWDDTRRAWKIVGDVYATGDVAAGG